MSIGSVLTIPYLLYKDVFEFAVGDRVVGRYRLHYRTLLLGDVSPGKTGVRDLDRDPRDLANFNYLYDGRYNDRGCFVNL